MSAVEKWMALKDHPGVVESRCVALAMRSALGLSDSAIWPDVAVAICLDRRDPESLAATYLARYDRAMAKATRKVICK